MAVQIHPLNTGYISLDKGAYVTGGSCYGQEITVPTNAFLVRADGENILVDTGMAPTERADWHHAGSYQPEGFRIDQRLAELGVEPGDIGAIVFTHLHWDHCFHLEMFSRAELWVHSRELAFARDPHVLYLKSYESPKLGVQPPFHDAEFRTVDDEHALNRRITMFPTPGHCPGHQSVAVETDGGVYVIAGDAVFADANLEPDEHRGLPFTPMGRYVNVFEMYDSMGEIMRRADKVLTGHGTGVFDQPVWS
jgi:glyoxylase-like metal-dependent hydrolase (beta-lactamase superfamily II)